MRYILDDHTTHAQLAVVADADILANRTSCAQITAPANRYIPAQTNAGVDDGEIANAASVAYHRIWQHQHVGPQLGTSGNYDVLMNDGAQPN